MLKLIDLRKIFVFLLVFVPMSVFAADPGMDIVIKLGEIKSIKSSEKSGDELYFSVTSYVKKSKPTFTRVPMFPVHWMTKHLEKVKDVILWSGTLAVGESRQVVLSLVEQDVQPWDVDDHLGSVKVTFANKGGEIKKQWSVPNYKDQTDVSKDSDTEEKVSFTFKGEGGEYKASFKMEVKEGMEKAK